MASKKPLQSPSLPPDKGLSRTACPRSGPHTPLRARPHPESPAHLSSLPPCPASHLRPRINATSCSLCLKAGVCPAVPPRALLVPVPHSSSGLPWQGSHPHFAIGDLAVPWDNEGSQGCESWPQVPPSPLRPCHQACPLIPAQPSCPTHLIEGHAAGCVQALGPLGLKGKRARSSWPDAAQVPLPIPLL